MPTLAHPVAGLDRWYLTALEELAHAHAPADTKALCSDVLEDSAPPEALDDLVATLCRHARVAASLASAAASLCSALVAERYHLHR